MPHRFQSGAANSGRSWLLSRLSPTCERLFQPPKKAAAGKIALAVPLVHAITYPESIARLSPDLIKSLSQNVPAGRF
jgi:hypothetical protein